MKKKTARKKPSKLRGVAKKLAPKFVAEELRTKRPRAQAIAIGLSRARAAAKKSKIDKIVAKYT